MNNSPSNNARVILMLTAPLLGMGSDDLEATLKPSEFAKLYRLLLDHANEPEDLLEISSLPFKSDLEPWKQRLDLLLKRADKVDRAWNNWQAHSIWITTIADAEYPQRLRARLKESAPAVLYGCGTHANVDEGGLAVVGSRSLEEQLIAYTQSIGALAAAASTQVVSGGARGADRAAMNGSLEAGGKAVGVLSDSLAKSVSNPAHRELIADDKLTLVSLADPSAGFSAGNAMQRNKIIYAIADAALIINSDLETGGTWAGAIEQLKKLRCVPIYVRSEGKASPGLEALRKKGAIPWPNPRTPEDFVELLQSPPADSTASQLTLL